MKKIFLSMIATFFLVLAIMSQTAGVPASESYVHYYINAYSNNAYSIFVQLTDIQGYTNSLASTHTIAINNATDISVLQTNKTTKLWGSTTNYMDGDGIKYEIVSNATDFICTAVNDSDFNYFLGMIWAQSTPDTWISPRGTLSYYMPWEFDDQLDGWRDYYDYSSPSDATTLTLTTAGYPVLEVTLQKGFVTTNVIDKVVTTNGTVIIIGSSIDAEGSTTNLQAKSGETTVDIPFYGREEAEAAIAAIPLPPTNAIAGFRLYDYGSNVWVRFAVSNLQVTLNIEE